MKVHSFAVNFGDETEMVDISNVVSIINEIYDEVEKSKVTRTMVEILDKIYDTIGTEAYCELANDNFGAWLIGEDK